MGKYKFVMRSIWFWWAFTTVVYSSLFVLMTYILRPSQTHIYSNPATVLGYITGFVGLFVPYGIAGFIALIFLPFSLVSLVIFIASMILLTLFFDNHHLNVRQRIVLSLLALLVLTMVADFFRGTPFESWSIFINGHFPSLNYP